MSRLNIKGAIGKKRMTLRSVAERMGITPMAFNTTINGFVRDGVRHEPNPSLSTLQRIADAIGCDVLDLFEDSREVRVMRESNAVAIDYEVHEGNESRIIHRCPKCGGLLKVSLALDCYDC